MEQTLIEYINYVGVDINKCFQYEHLSYPLRFVSGFGPRKARFILSLLKMEINDRIKT